MARHPQLELDLQLCFPLYAASRALTRAYAPLLEPYGLTYPQYLALLALWSGPDQQTVGDLGRRLQLDSGTLTPLLKRLEQAGLVERHRHQTDERRVVVSVTPAGDALQDDLSHVPAALVERIGLPLDEWTTLRGSLDRLLAALDRSDTESDAGGEP